MALSGATFLSLLSVVEKTKPRSVLNHLSVALLPLSEGDRPAKVCVRVHLWLLTRGKLLPITFRLDKEVRPF